MALEAGRRSDRMLAGARLLLVGADAASLARWTHLFAQRGAVVLARDTFDEAQLDLDDYLPDVVVLASEAPAGFLQELHDRSEEVGLVRAGDEATAVAAVRQALDERREGGGPRPRFAGQARPGPHESPRIPT